MEFPQGDSMDFQAQLQMLKEQHTQQLMQIEQLYYQQQQPFKFQLQHYNPHAGLSSTSQMDQQPIPMDEQYYAPVDEPPRTQRRLSTTWVAFGSSQQPDMTLVNRSWTPRVTTPVPFRFEARARSRPKMRSQVRMEEDLAMREAVERAELEKRFKAEPIPPSTLESRLKLLEEQQAQRRADVKARSIEITQQKERPFTFYYRDKQKWLDRLHKKDPEPEKYPGFKANPIPITMSIAPTDVDKVEQERKRRVNERSQRLLQEASLPPRMEMWAKTQGKPMENEVPTQERECTFQPHVNHHIPDYKRLQAQFQSTLDRNKRMRPVTPAAPFHLHELNTIQKVIDDVARDYETLPETRWPFMGTRTYVKPTAIPAQSTPRKRALTNKTTELRKHTVRKSLEEMRVREGRDLETEKARKERSKQMADRLKPHLVTNQDEFLERNKKAREAFLADQRRQVVAYNERVQKMEEKVSARPFLFQDNLKAMARKKAKQKFEQTIIESGLKPEDYTDSEENEQ
eukprot:TRINITY_DN14173_c0_g1_i1.p1 TRINITY_DN14173_c0_g1~~TRINITY_DN14173_c0_g1_i1.p1  ORF type:complete len:514 (-),score=123.66 TRINITY_DN14173_c0_g1_i1:41-1582(-)